MQLYHEIIQYEIYSLKVLKYINTIASTHTYYICLACAADFKTRLLFARLNDLNNYSVQYTFFYLLRADAARTTTI